MSYILEALKKAQAERQLGETPGIHTPTLDTPAGAGAPLRKPLVAAVAVMAVVIVALAVVVWRQAAAPMQPVAAAPVPSAQPVAAAAVPMQPAQPVAAAPMQPAQPVATAQVQPALPVATAQVQPVQPVAAAPMQPAQQSLPAPAPTQPVPVAPAPQSAKAAPPAAAKAPEPPARAAVPAGGGAPKGKSEEPATEEPVQALRDLPEPIRRAVPPVAMSGYMYSPNPADRLILIDKVLRREGDEVAPGLVLERLEPKGAVFAFRGYRFRMPY